MRVTSLSAVHASAASRMSALDAKCQVVDDSATPASAATRRCVTAATPSAATIRTVAVMIDSRIAASTVDQLLPPRSGCYKYDRTSMPGPSTRRSFFGAAGGAALLCTIGGREIDVSAPGGLREADRAAAALRAPKAVAAQAIPQIQPAPGGVRREYWVQAETVRWAITPKRKDEWHNRPVGGRNSFTAYVYRPMTPGSPTT